MFIFLVVFFPCGTTLATLLEVDAVGISIRQDIIQAKSIKRIFWDFNGYRWLEFDKIKNERGLICYSIA